MTELYLPSDYAEARALQARQKKIFLTILVCGVLVNAAIFVCKLIFLKWGESSLPYYLTNVILASALIIILMIYRSIPMRICRSYVPLLFSFTHNVSKAVDGIYLKTNENKIDRAGLKFFEMLFYEGTDSKGQVVIGRILLDETRGAIGIERGDRVKYRACDKVLIAYEIIEHNALSGVETTELERMIDNKLGTNMSKTEEK